MTTPNLLGPFDPRRNNPPQTCTKAHAREQARSEAERFGYSYEMLQRDLDRINRRTTYTSDGRRSWCNCCGGHSFQTLDHFGHMMLEILGLTDAECAKLEAEQVAKGGSADDLPIYQYVSFWVCNNCQTHTLKR